jgi:hypothetical protein
VVLFEDETILRLFPPLRAKWAPKGRQPHVRITGGNARCVLFGAINPKTGHRILMRGRGMRQGEFQTYLRTLHRRYRGRPLCLIMDEAACHTATRSRELAGKLDIECLWLPRQTPELNAVDHLWRPAKSRIAANRQYKTVDEEAEMVERYITHLSSQKALTLAGVRSKHFWLRRVV